MQARTLAFSFDVAKIPIKREQSEACFNYAGREIFRRSQKDATPSAENDELRITTNRQVL